MWGCTLSDEGYVLSYTKGAIENEDERKPLAAPQREGYTFVGWSTQSGSATAEYTAEELTSVADGTVLYAVWEVTPEQPEAPEQSGQLSGDVGANAEA